MSGRYLDGPTIGHRGHAHLDLGLKGLVDLNLGLVSLDLGFASQEFAILRGFRCSKDLKFLPKTVSH